ncbi:MAG: glycogen/starch/alpha-glucan family phosphorylase [Lachnospiraceae bacterium]|nr:glycogen/starch/alpha-glucan family phosphorylase [Lachnospiraceae bacterium]
MSIGTNMQRDVLTLNMEHELQQLAQTKYGKTLRGCNNHELYYVLLSYCERLTRVTETNAGEKKVYYISAEFLPGKFLAHNLINLKIYDGVCALLARCGKNLEQIEEIEKEPALGIGGPGRIAAGTMDAMATLGIPGEGIGLNYHCGYFRQKFEDRLQKAEREDWMTPVSWEHDTDVSFEVNFGGQTVLSRMYTVDVVGYNSGVNRLRLFDLDSVDDSIIKEGISFDKKDIRHNLTLFLCPDEKDRDGRIFNLYQQYFLVSNAAQWILHEMKEKQYDLRHLFDYAVIQIADTYPALIIPELVRILTEDKAMSMDEAVFVVTRTCSCAEHTLPAKDMDVWPEADLSKAVPQLMPIIRELDRRVKAKFDDPSVWIIDAGGDVHMDALSLHYCCSACGAFPLCPDLPDYSLPPAFFRIYPDRFIEEPDGISMRRWLLGCNHRLANYLSTIITDAYKKDATQLERLLAFYEDDQVLQTLQAVKQANKMRLAEYIRQNEDVDLDPNGIFDIQIKQMGGYRRQLMNALYIICRYLEIKRGRKPTRPINFIFGGKAAPGCEEAQDIVHLLLVLQEIIADDPEVSPWIRMVLVADCNVTYMEKMVPAADISEQISLASAEMCATSAMKMMLNGALTLGTDDGTAAEIRRLVGEDNIYLFGSDAEDAAGHRLCSDCSAEEIFDANPQIREAVNFITGEACMQIGHRVNLERLSRNLTEADRYMTLSDLPDYIRVKDRMIGDYEDTRRWLQKSLVNIAKAGFFSSDRSAAEINRDIWKISR